MPKDFTRLFVAIVALLSLTLSAPSLAAVYKCMGPNGKLTYSDQPCAADENSQQITITPDPLHSAPSPGGASSVPAQNRQAEVQACTAKAFGEWQQAMGSNMLSPHVQIDKVRQFRNQCIRQLNQSTSAAVQQSSPSTPSTTDPVADRRAREAQARQCSMTNYNDWIRAQSRPLPDEDTRITKRAEIDHLCRSPLGLPDSPSPQHGPEQAAFTCGLQHFAEWRRSHPEPMSDKADLAKQTAFIDECRVNAGFPPIGRPDPDTATAAKLATAPGAPTAGAPAQPVSTAAATPVTRPTPVQASAAVQHPPLPPAPGGPPAGNRDPAQVLDALADRIYSIGETTGKGADMIAAEVSAADEVRRYLATGATDGLLTKTKGQQSSLEGAAYMGYPNIVAALLTSNTVKAHINDADDTGMTPWIAAMFSMRQTVWTCNPTVWDDPFRFVPTLVSQPYYVMNPTPPYAKTRELLEKASATVDMAKAKDVWVAFCKNQTPEGIAKVKASTDLQKTVQELGAAELMAKIATMQKKAAEAQKK